MTHSLNFRLLAAFTLIIVVIFGTVFFFTYHNTRSEISRIEQRLQTAQDRRVAIDVARYFQLVGSWDGVQPAITQLAKLYNTRIILTDNAGVVQADSDGKLTGTQYSTNDQGSRW